MSDLLKMYKALQDETIAQRVQGAAVRYAHYLIGIGGDNLATDFAKLVLENPLAQWQDMQVEVVANGTILEKVALSPDGQQVYSTNVTDQDISYVVETTWEKMASRYVVAPEAPETPVDPEEEPAP